MANRGVVDITETIRTTASKRVDIVSLHCLDSKTLFATVVPPDLFRESQWIQPKHGNRGIVSIVEEIVVLGFTNNIFWFKDQIVLEGRIATCSETVPMPISVHDIRTSSQKRLRKPARVLFVREDSRGWILGAAPGGQLPTLTSYGVPTQLHARYE